MILTTHVKLPIARVSKFYDKGPQQVGRTASRSARGKIAGSGIPNCLLYFECLRFIHNLQRVTAGRIIKSGSAGRGLEAHGVKASRFKIFKNGAHAFHSSVILCTFAVKKRQRRCLFLFLPLAEEQCHDFLSFLLFFLFFIYFKSLFILSIIG